MARQKLRHFENAIFGVKLYKVYIASERSLPAEARNHGPGGKPELECVYINKLDKSDNIGFFGRFLTREANTHTIHGVITISPYV